MPPLRLEVFGTEPAPGRTTVVTDLTAMEEARLAAYEQGYTAGWDDASTAEAGNQARLGEEIARNLQSLAFTYHEARQHVLQAVEPLLLQMVDRVLPDMARAALGPMVLDVLRPMAAGISDLPAILSVNPVARPAVERLVAQDPGLSMRIEEEPTLGEGQAHLRLGQSETRIDLDRAVADIAAAVRAFFDLSQMERRHG